jgi:hypothetical protein
MQISIQIFNNYKSTICVDTLSVLGRRKNTKNANFNKSGTRR